MDLHQIKPPLINGFQLYFLLYTSIHTIVIFKEYSPIGIFMEMSLKKFENVHWRDEQREQHCYESVDCRTFRMHDSKIYIDVLYLYYSSQTE